MILTNETLTENISIFEKLDSLFVNGSKAGILAIIFYLIIMMIVKKIIRRFIDQKELKHKFMVSKVINIILYTLFTFAILSQFSFASSLLTTLLASGGIVAVVVGLASQEAASNIVGGLMILASKPFSIGDTIILKEYGLRGCVKGITINHTIIETLDKNSVLIPNTVMNKAIIENMTQTSDYKVTYIYVDISYESDIDKAISIMQDVIIKHPLFYDQTTSDDEIKVPVHCMEYKDSGISLRAKVTTRNIDDSFVLCSDCRINIKKAFDENNIEIPYPHVQIQNSQIR